MIKNLILLFALLSVNLGFAQQKTPPKKICLTEEEFAATLQALEDLLKANQKLLKIAKEYEEVLASTPKIEIEPLVVVMDEKSRVFLQEKVPGTLNLGSLNYDLQLKIGGTVAKREPPPYGFNLKFKASYLYSFETNRDGEVQGHHSGGIGIEPFYYKHYNINLIIGSRFVGPALGFDITEHFGILAGVGLNWTRSSAIFVGTSFDF